MSFRQRPPGSVQSRTLDFEWHQVAFQLGAVEKKVLANIEKSWNGVFCTKAYFN